MKLKTLLVICAIVTLIFGIAFVIIPWFVYSLYGVEANPQLNYIGRFFGSAMIAIGLVAWLARNTSHAKMKKAIAWAFFIGDGIGFIVALTGQLDKVANALGWLNVVLYFLFALGFAFFAFAKNKEPEKKEG